MADAKDEELEWLLELLGKPLARDNWFQSPSAATSSTAAGATSCADAGVVLETAVPIHDRPYKVEPAADVIVAASGSAASKHDGLHAAFPGNAGKAVVMSKNAAEPIAFKLCSGSHAGIVLEHAINVVKNLLEQGCMRFKLGVTKNPVHRWSNREYGYKHEKAFNRAQPMYATMLVVIEVDGSQAAGFAEAALIREFIAVPGCMNKALGGEGIGQNVPGKHYLYCVYCYV
jgi:hypothetical protein